MKTTVLKTEQAAKWDRLVGEGRHDFYSLASYHQLAEERGEGEARLVVIEDDACRLALPVLVRRVAEVPGLESSDLTDVTSVYGYAGPLVRPEQPEGASRERIVRGLEAHFRDLGAVCVFSRLHPLLDQEHALGGLGIVREVGPTVSIDLTTTPDEQWAAVRHGHKYDLARLRRAGFECLRDERLRYLDEFAELYIETMRRVGADAYYMFDRDYFRRFFSLAGVEVSLFVCIHDGVVAGGGVFTLCGGIVQYHLSGTRVDYLRSAPTKLILDEVRKWSADRGARSFHLGGGIGSERDALFDFKAGFSKRRHAFRVWNWIRDDDAYRELVSRREAFLKKRNERLSSSSYFPEYRAPAVVAGGEVHG